MKSGLLPALFSFYYKILRDYSNEAISQYGFEKKYIFRSKECDCISVYYKCDHIN